MPEGKQDWKPHDKSMAFGYLSELVAIMPSWISMGIDKDELDLNPPGGSNVKRTPLHSRADYVAALDKAAADARRDKALVLIARCDSRPAESLDQVCERLGAYAEAGADAVGVQVTDVADFRRIGATTPAPMITLWPKAQMSATEFFAMGYRIALTPSSIPLAATAAARAMLLELKQTGNDRDYFARQQGFAEANAWYKKIGSAGK